MKRYVFNIKINQDSKLSKYSTGSLIIVPKSKKVLKPKITYLAVKTLPELT